MQIKCYFRLWLFLVVVAISPAINSQTVQTSPSKDTSVISNEIPLESVEFNGVTDASSHRQMAPHNPNLVEDSPIASMLDSLANIRYFKDYYLQKNNAGVNVYNYPVDLIPSFSDSVYAARINELDRETPIELSYNSAVKGFIDLYAIRKRQLTSRMLGLANFYFPMFEEYLDKYNMPLEMKYLAIVESALNPVATSKAGAKGLWQFMYNTGKMYGLKSTSFVEDRYDPFKATDAACRHLSDLYKIYDDWFLALAAYNAGAGNVNKAIRKAGGVKNYWIVWPYLPRETQGYVPAFIAVYYIMNYNQEHNLYPLDPGWVFYGVDTVSVSDVLSFDQINELLNVPIADLKFLNPAYKLGVIPATPTQKYILKLPKEFIGDYVNNEQALYSFKTRKGIERAWLQQQIAMNNKSLSTDKKVHVVRKGETLSKIASKYNVSVTQLKKWNKLKSNSLKYNQKLVIYNELAMAAPPDTTKKSVVRNDTTAVTPKPDSTSVAIKSEKDSTEVKNNTPAKTPGKISPRYHTVKSGESLGSISKLYKCSVTDLKSWNKLKNNTIHPKQKLIVSRPVTSNEKTN